MQAGIAWNNPASDYGAAWQNIALVNGQTLHENGFSGAGIDIAVIDAGFSNIQSNPMMRGVKIAGAKSFIYEDTNPFSDDEHGLWVTSCMAANLPDEYIGTAPEANYWLLRSDDQSTEYPIEEDYWVAAIEFADSVGVAVVNSSLSYKLYDYLATSYTFEQMDGKTALISRAANIATSKGMLIINSAGNDRSWVGAPADAPGVLSVGGVDSVGGLGEFTAYGTTADGRIKPDVMALGTRVSLVSSSGVVTERSGTSYSSPIICGLVACLWQAYPELTNNQLLAVIKESTNRYPNAEPPFGYGIPDMERAFEIARSKR